MAVGESIYDGMKLMENVDKLMKERGIIAAQLSRMTGLQESRFSKWFDGKGHPNVDQAHAIAKALGTTIDALLDDAPPSLRVLTPDEIRLLGAYEAIRRKVSVDEAIRRMSADTPQGLTDREGKGFGTGQGTG